MILVFHSAGWYHFRDQEAFDTMLLKYQSLTYVFRFLHVLIVPTNRNTPMHEVHLCHLNGNKGQAGDHWVSKRASRTDASRHWNVDKRRKNVSQCGQRTFHSFPARRLQYSCCSFQPEPTHCCVTVSGNYCRYRIIEELPGMLWLIYITGFWYLPTRNLVHIH
jgi:hypothetical protein